MLTVYGRSEPPCPYCAKAKELLDSTGLMYIYVDVGKDITREEFKLKFPHQKTVPYILDNENDPIGGYEELKSYWYKVSETFGEEF